MSEQPLFKHKLHPHIPRNVNQVHHDEQQGKSLYARFNEDAAVWTTRLFSTMEIFWVINVFMAFWIIGNSIGLWHFDPLPFPLLLMIINIPQLPLLPLLAIGQAVLGRKQELQSNEQYNFTLKTYNDIEQVMQHLSSQDTELLKQTAELLKQTPLLEEIRAQLIQSQQAEPPKRKRPTVVKTAEVSVGENLSGS